MLQHISEKGRLLSILTSQAKPTLAQSPISKEHETPSTLPQAALPHFGEKPPSGKLLGAHSQQHGFHVHE